MGHTYLPPVAVRQKPTDSQLATQTSRQNTPLVESIGGSKKHALASGTTSAYMDARLLEESFNLSMRYGDEYMDENPITGQPGAFNLTSTGRKAKDNLAISTQKAASQDQNTAGVSPTGEKPSEVPPIRKGSKLDKTPKTPGLPKPKRKKSKVPNSAGGITPT